MKDVIRFDLTSYFGNCENGLTDEQAEIASQYQSAWENVPCDAEGLTPEQDKMLDDILDECIAEINERIRG